MDWFGLLSNETTKLTKRFVLARVKHNSRENKAYNLSQVHTEMNQKRQMLPHCCWLAHTQKTSDDNRKLDRLVIVLFCSEVSSSSHSSPRPYNQVVLGLFI